jgi:thiamine pyrophosphokinase
MKIFPLPSENTTVDAVILANGEFPVHNIPVSILKNCPYIVCCDGAVNKMPSSIEPCAIVGDCDSLSATNKEKYKDIIHRISEQDSNDLTKSVKFCIEQGKKRIAIVGATGKREDHTIGNISLLAQYLDLSEDIFMITDYGIFNAIDSFSSFESYKGQQVSIFCISPSPVTFHNLRYPVENRQLTNWWQGTLNEAESDVFAVDAKGKVIVFRNF